MDKINGGSGEVGESGEGGEDKSSASRKPGSATEIREHLANERTLLAWVRTGVGLISVGFVVERAGALASTTGAGQNTAISSEVFGVALVALGCLALICGAFQFFRTRRMISEGVFAAGSAPYLLIVAGSLVLAVSFIVYAVIS